MKKLYFIVVGLVVISILVLLYTFNPLKYSFFPKCPFRLLTGLDCPGCGSQRALYQLLHGNIRKAADYNCLLVLSVPFLAIHYSYFLVSIITGNNIQWRFFYKPATPKIIFVLVITFWIIRNIPSSPFSYFAS